MIRLAEEKDIPGIAATYAALFRDRGSRGGPSQWQVGVYPTIAVPLRQVPRRTMYVLEEDGAIRASLWLTHEQPEEYASVDWRFPAEGREVLVGHTLCIPPQLSGRGYGTTMVRFLQEYAARAGCRAVRIDTCAANAPARALYAKNGFRLAGEGPMLLAGLISEDQVYLEWQVGRNDNDPVQ